MEDVGLAVGLLVVLVLGFGVRPILRLITRPQPPQGVDEEVWLRIVGRGAELPNAPTADAGPRFAHWLRDARRELRDQMRSREGGEWLGRVERLFSFGVFWLGAYEQVLIAWLAFKVASKWEAWSNVVQVPTDLPTVDDKTDYFRARSQLGSWLFTRFVLGTLLNVLIGLIGAAIGRSFGSSATG